MLDGLTGGRLIAGLVVGGGPSTTRVQHQPDRGPGTVPGGGGSRGAGLDRARPLLVRRRVVPPAVREPVGPSAPADRTRRCGSRAGAAVHESTSARSGALATWASPTTRHPSRSPAQASRYWEAIDAAGVPRVPENLGCAHHRVRSADTDRRPRASPTAPRPTSAGKPRRRVRRARARCGCRPGTSTPRPSCSSSRICAPGPTGDETVRRRCSRRTRWSAASRRSGSGSSVGPAAPGWDRAGLAVVRVTAGRPRPAQHRAIRPRRSSRGARARRGGLRGGPADTPPASAA